MQRLRTTFTRSRTPTGAEMKMQNSLEVPKQVRSASFDEMQLEAQRASAQLLKQQSSSSASADERSSEAGFLQVPLAAHQQRSHSFDSAAASVGSDDSGAFLEVPRRLKARRSSSTKTPPPCIHCHYLEEYERRMTAEQRYFIDHRELSALSNTSSEVSEDEEDDDDEAEDEEGEAAGGETESSELASGLDEARALESEHEHEHDPDDDAAEEMDIRIGNMSLGSSIEESRARLPRQMRRHTIGSSSMTSGTSEDEGLENSDHGSPHFGNTLLPPQPATPCGITFTLSPTNGDYPSPPLFPIDPSSPPLSPCPLVPPVTASISCTAADSDDAGAAMGLPVRTRRRSISRQEAVFVEPTGNSLENVSHEEVDNNKSSVETADSMDEASTMATCGSPTISPFFAGGTTGGPPSSSLHSAFVVRDIYLTVPDLKRDRAASVDSCFSKLSSGPKAEELQPSADGCFLTVPNINATRSRSVDIVLPTDEQARYKALAMTGSTATYADGRRTASASNSRRPIRIVPDWTENAVQGEHYWKPTSASGDLCCLNEECIKSGQRMKCSACQLIAHQNCIPLVNEKSQLACKPTYRDVGIRQYREQTTTHHHWVHRKLEKGKCKQCGKQAVQSKLFGSKEIVALSCAWCHEIYHNKESCFNQAKIGEECRLGNYAPIIVPPSWIVKLPSKGNFKSSIRVSNKNNAAAGSSAGGGGGGGGAGGKSKKQTQRRQKGQKDEKKEPRAFIVKPIPSPEVIPVVVFINPKSGGNQGVKLLGKFQHLLNPRQVFDLTQGGPKMGLDMFRKAPNLRVLACGGDGTVGWVLSVLDTIHPPLQPVPAVGVLPLGTGNDLARALGWGGGYTDEPIGKILREIGMSQCVLMDRWRVKVTPNDDVTDDHVDRSKANVPLNVINNYFSFGVDAHIALEFHEAREAHPERFNSRLRNKMYYGQMGGKDLILRQYRNLSQWVTLECDGQDFTGKLRDAGCHAVLFLNIPSYGGGTHPWNDSFGSTKPSIDDGLMEVVGLTTYQLPMLQAGMHGTCICQCRKARIITKRTIPMQVDGEACRVKPSVIEIELLNKALMLSKRKHGRGDVQVNPLEKMQLHILRVTMQQYEQYHYDKEMLRKLANKLGQIEIESQCDLEHVRNMLNAKFEESISYPKVSQDWCFIDSCTAEHYFRIDRAQEHLHYICDIAIDELYILDHEAATMPQTPDQERSFAAFSQRQAQNERRQLDQAQGRGPGSTDEDLQIGSKPIKVMKWKSNKDRLFSFNEDVFGYGFSPILEQTSDAVLLAAQSGDLNMLRALHEQGYSLQSVNKNGQTALHFACKYNHKDIVKYIISCATRRVINMADKERGQTALHIAAEQNRRDICVMLVAAGANLQARDSGGNTAMMVAFNKNANEIATYLESKQGTPQPADGAWPVNDSNTSPSAPSM
ncbi:eye-specific diacylglycerol kinase isoform X1 [Drosophila ananassae]|uniref:eye-specific diacylglycerol kinase isoform X1 n=2 Tax=Drosophila ananassae TaxID=7217 RepID=UPI0013A5DF77|nr:eye-specific diacylglycerol kinase isoform X1 [Drosophila ananassae]XP_044573482.1 eye-specific diacylglycerol kinase isoform X1 [Drosophila ananassae]XP_044573483.1 eye-specific diacylglycerol kinase isoform X1 [Drosophila ananassae]